MRNPALPKFGSRLRRMGDGIRSWKHLETLFKFIHWVNMIKGRVSGLFIHNRIFRDKGLRKKVDFLFFLLLLPCLLSSPITISLTYLTCQFKLNASSTSKSLLSLFFLFSSDEKLLKFSPQPPPYFQYRKLGRYGGGLYQGESEPFSI